MNIDFWIVGLEYGSLRGEGWFYFDPLFGEILAYNIGIDTIGRKDKKQIEVDYKQSLFLI